MWVLSLALVAGVSRSHTGAIVLLGGLLLHAALSRRASAWVLALLAGLCVAHGGAAARRMDADEAVVRAAAARHGAALIDLHGRVAGFPRTGPHGTVFDFATRVGGRPVTVEVRAAFFDVAYGDEYRLRARLLAAAERDRDYLRARGVAGRARVRLRDATLAGRGGGGWLARTVFWPVHRRARCDLSRLMGNDAALVLGLLLGERGGMDDATRDAVRRLGIAHLLAISGMHLTSIAACVVWLTRRWPAATTAVLVTALSLYTGTVGNVESLTRAYVMSLLLAAAHVLVRPLRPLDALAASFLLMMLAAPLSFGAVGLQLSFAATFALVAVLPVLRARGTPSRTAAGRMFRAAWRTARNAFLVSVAVEVFIAPLQLHHFGALSVAGPVATVVFLVPVTALLLGAFPVVLVAAVTTQAAGPAGALAAASVWTVDLMRTAGAVSPALLAHAPPEPVLYYASLGAGWALRHRRFGPVLALAGVAASFAARA